MVLGVASLTRINNLTRNALIGGGIFSNISSGRQSRKALSQASDNVQRLTDQAVGRINYLDRLAKGNVNLSYASSGFSSQSASAQTQQTQINQTSSTARNNVYSANEQIQSSIKSQRRGIGRRSVGRSVAVGSGFIRGN